MAIAFSCFGNQRSIRIFRNPVFLFLKAFTASRAWLYRCMCARRRLFGDLGGLEIFMISHSHCAHQTRMPRRLIPVLRRRKTQEFGVDGGIPSIQTALANFGCVLRPGLLYQTGHYSANQVSDIANINVVEEDGEDDEDREDRTVPGCDGKDATTKHVAHKDLVQPAENV
jgi:hypothetical protein